MFEKVVIGTIYDMNNTILMLPEISSPMDRYNLSHSTSCTLNYVKIHRNHTPIIRKNASKFALGKELSAALAHHDWNRNIYLRELRKRKKQKLSIRSERRETLQALANEMIALADYSIDSDYLFEVMTNVETLAKNIKQLHIYPSGRKAYDPVTNALKMLEEANLIIILREMDHESKQRKAMRIWLRPEFFYAFGFSESRLRQKVKNLHKYRAKKGLLTEAKNMYKLHIQRLKYSNVADISDKFALKNLLLNIKNTFLSKESISNLEKKPEQSHQSHFEGEGRVVSDDIEAKERALYHLKQIREMLARIPYKVKPK